MSCLLEGFALNLLKTVLICALTLVGLVGCETADQGLTHLDNPLEFTPGIIKPVLRTGVRIRVSVSAQGKPVIEDLMKEVSAQGEIVMPYVGMIKCANLSIEQLEAELTKAYAKYYVNPVVTAFYMPMVEGSTSPWGMVLVLGEVARAGQVQIPQTCDLTLTRALQDAGGLKPFANPARVRVTRTGKGNLRQCCEIDTEKIGEQGRRDLDLILMPGDVVFVPEYKW